MSQAAVADLPVPVAPSRTTSFCPARRRRSRSSMAAGWSPDGRKSDTTSNRPAFGTMSLSTRMGPTVRASSDNPGEPQVPEAHWSRDGAAGAAHQLGAPGGGAFDRRAPRPAEQPGLGLGAIRAGHLYLVPAAGGQQHRPPADVARIPRALSRRAQHQSRQSHPRPGSRSGRERIVDRRTAAAVLPRSVHAVRGDRRAMAGHLAVARRRRRRSCRCHPVHRRGHRYRHPGRSGPRVAPARRRCRRQLRVRRRRGRTDLLPRAGPVALGLSRDRSHAHDHGHGDGGVVYVRRALERLLHRPGHVPAHPQSATMGPHHHDPAIMGRPAVQTRHEAQH